MSSDEHGLSTTWTECNLYSAGSSPSASPPGSPLIGSLGGRKQEKARNHARRAPAQEGQEAVLTCPGRALLRGGAVRQQLSLETAQPAICLPLNESQELEHLLLSMAQASYTLEVECAAVACYNSRNERQEFYSIRQKATNKMRALINYIDQRGALTDDGWRQEVEVGLHRLHRRVGYLAPPGPADELCHDPTLVSRAHQLFHLQLDLRVLSVSALARLSDLSDQPPPRDSPGGPTVPWLSAVPGRHRWRRAAHALAWELAVLAHNKMRETPLAELADTCAFSCGCEKGAWLALRRLLGPGGRSAAVAGPGGPAGLWAELEPLFAHILSPPPPSPEATLADEFPLMETEWSEAPLFLTWLMSSVSDVFRYDDQDTFKPDLTCDRNTPPCDRNTSPCCDRNTSLLLSLVSAAAAGAAETEDPAGGERRLRCVLALCGRLTELWGATPALSNTLWEVVVRRLVRPQPPGPVSVLQMTSTVPRSGRRWWESVSEPPPPEDSFGQYLLLLPAQLAAGADCWRQLRGRVLLRLHAKRAVQLSAAGLRAACTLFLTLIHLVPDDVQLVDKFISFLSQVSESSAHEILVCRAYFAAAHLLLESGRDVGAVAAAAAAQADRELRAAADARPFSLALVAAYWEECSELVRASPRLDKSEYQLVTSGWRAYLGCCGPSELARGLSVLLQLAGKLLGNIQQLQPMAHIVDTEVVTRKEQYSQLTERLRLVAPLLHTLALSASPPPELAQLAATLTLVPGAGCELHHFTADTVTPSVCAAYVTELLAAAPERLAAGRDGLVRLWLRCWAGGADLAELGPMTAAVARREAALVPAGPPADPTTARQFTERLARLAEQSKEGRERVNAIFSDLAFIDAYLRGPRAASPGLSHLFLVFGLVVKHLINVLELRKVVSIIQRLLLPPAVYNSEKALAPPMRNALARSIPLFLAGIARADYATEKSYRRFVKDTLVHYMYRFPSDSHPLLDVFRSDEVSDQFKDFVMQMMAETFLQKIGGKFHDSLLQAAQCLSALVSADRGGHLTALVARRTASPLLELLLSLEEPRAKRAATDLLKLLCRSQADGVRPVLSSAVERLLDRQLAFHSGRVFQLLEVLAVLAPALTRDLLPTLEHHVRRTELRRGVGEDRILRNGLARVQRRLAAVGEIIAPSADNGC
ncbi:protein MMS22-like [Amphibalanus amphitrite]|uniref:protein MMS22-like n=1 Tax=Amphibalanus amphitrite TaxID=1232801 RepID=UPI001C90A6BE|nr:protein MMS22-like [Amphibalanus amphitrite]